MLLGDVSELLRIKGSLKQGMVNSGILEENGNVPKPFFVFKMQISL